MQETENINKTDKNDLHNKKQKGFFSNLFFKLIKKPLFLVVVFGVVCFAGFSLLNCCVETQEKKIEILEEKILNLKSDVSFLQFVVLQKDSTKGKEKLTVLFKLYDLDNREVARFTDIVLGEELFIDFQVVKLPSSYLAFPAKYFSENQAPIDGKLFYKHYDKGGFPLIYATVATEKKLPTEILKTFFKRLQEPEEDVSDFGSAVHNIKSISSFEVGMPYSVIFHPQKGGLEIKGL